MTRLSLNQRLYGSRRIIGIREFVTNSGLFWLFDALRVMSVDGVGAYAREPAHFLLLIASVIQTWVISRHPDKRLWMGNFIAPVLYMIGDVVLEGTDYFSQPYHVVYWGYASGMALAYGLYKHWPVIAAVVEGTIRTALLPLIYMISEESIWSGGRMTMYDYWINDPAHLFILLSALLLGVLLGAAAAMRDQFERMLHDLMAHLERLTNWVFDPALVFDSFADTSLLGLQRVERTILFMDIRGFTTWSEAHDLVEVVQMVNDYYTLAEQIIDQHNGFKLQLIGDEILTRFSAADDAVQAACALQEPILRLLDRYHLGAGIGLHTGDVIEGLIGSQQTRQYGIIGDVVNTAARFQSAAKSGEIVLSGVTYQQLSPAMVDCIAGAREEFLTVKGKTKPLQVFVVPSILME